ncbi:MAG: hypothetical protein H8Z69_01255 [Nanohaloarchaea archaeon]|nr:hypothetical protein [Candidatus Nanohaloarchaea archaeon]
MIELVCHNCGEREEKNVLPGKHAVLGTINRLESNAECCKKPQYFDSRGFKENKVSKDLGGLLGKA